MNFGKPVLGFCAWGSGIGKTTLLTSLIPLLVTRGVRLSVVKHAHHTFDIDQPGKDSYRLREAGAVQMLLGSNKRWALMTERSRTENDEEEVTLGELLPHLDADQVDLVLVEGFKSAAIPKIEVFRPVLGNPLQAASDAHIIAVAADGPVEIALPVLDLNTPAAIADFVLDWLHQQQPMPFKKATP
ncbi:molybdopterin-guanine dinucleotide biosynthesis protein B [Novimethylophilus kurashikiensis]|uniref:Molybdopterin-guanine dinucleotide biosynthesis protein B n=1 Tax=Novimethylophilus kurashikiensis TaxID=1825523 RepID=A0A2R5FAR5_9PROT|nr:molybdopterin-guanine dinucleotide biosynthesis protein B [Novimethylophilus kurashikiensis]GBG15316.1 molybdopterin-guanine dinucleotide biosynthesis protein B [Novimethylophilus kurashikiensis]